MSPPPFPVLRSDRLTLKQLSHQDSEQIYAIFSDPQVVAHYDVERFTNVQQATKLVDYFDQKYAQDAGIRWAIRHTKSKQFLGTCGFTHWNRFDHSAVIGYELAPQHWGHGYAKEAVTTIIDYIFAASFHFYVNRIEAIILPSNQPSLGLVKKLGFEFEGRLREKCYWNDAFHDMDMYAILKKDWQLPGEKK